MDLATPRPQEGNERQGYRLNLQAKIHERMNSDHNRSANCDGRNDSTVLTRKSRSRAGKDEGHQTGNQHQPDGYAKSVKNLQVAIVSILPLEHR